MRAILLLGVLSGFGAAQIPMDRPGQITSTVRAIDDAGRHGLLDTRDVSPMRVDGAAEALTGSRCYASDDLARSRPYDPVFRDGALVCEDRRTVVPR